MAWRPGWEAKIFATLAGPSGGVVRYPLVCNRYRVKDGLAGTVDLSNFNSWFTGAIPSLYDAEVTLDWATFGDAITGGPIGTAMPAFLGPVNQLGGPGSAPLAGTIATAAFIAQSVNPFIPPAGINATRGIRAGRFITLEIYMASAAPNFSVDNVEWGFPSLLIESAEVVGEARGAQAITITGKNVFAFLGPGENTVGVTNTVPVAPGLAG